MKAYGKAKKRKKTVRGLEVMWFKAEHYKVSSPACLKKKAFDAQWVWQAIKFAKKLHNTKGRIS
jgi:hypothetical protein